jgi:hypothetical protein
MVLATLGINKVHEGTDSIFFHYSRMYLSLPIVLAFALSLFKPDFEPRIYYLWVFVPYYYYNSQTTNIENIVTANLKPNQNDVVIVSKIEPILLDCDRINKVCQEHKVDLFVIANHFYYDAYAHGCTACVSKFPKTLKPFYERRTWRLLEDENKVYETIMFIDMYNHIADGHNFIKKIPGTVDLYLVENNTLKTLKLLDTLNIKYRQFKE